MRIWTILLLLLPLSALAEQPAAGAYAQCQQAAQSSMDALACMQQELKRVDRRLNRNYRQAMARIQSFRRDDLRRVQRLWIRYRDARCQFFNHRESGSGGRLDEMQCLIDETARRSRELDELY